jgi:hypothetical protein
MISEWMAVLLLAGAGAVFDGAVQVVIHSPIQSTGKVLALTIVNGVFVFMILAAAYFVDGFEVRGQWGEGWLDWVTVVECVLAGYGWIFVASFWRFVTQTE